MATFEIKIIDARTFQTKSNTEAIAGTGDIIEPVKLTKFEIFFFDESLLYKQPDFNKIKSAFSRDAKKRIDEKEK